MSDLPNCDRIREETLTLRRPGAGRPTGGSGLAIELPSGAGPDVKKRRDPHPPVDGRPLPSRAREPEIGAGPDLSENRHVVCAIDDLPPGERREVAVGGEYGITVFNVGGTFYALRNKCPHKGGPVCRGRLRPHIAPAGVSQWVYEREGEVIKCPYHNWEFDICTGQALYDARMRIKTYSVALEDAQVVLYL